MTAHEGGLSGFFSGLAGTRASKHLDIELFAEVADNHAVDDRIGFLVLGDAPKLLLAKSSFRHLPVPCAKPL